MQCIQWTSGSLIATQYIVSEFGSSPTLQPDLGFVPALSHDAVSMFLAAIDSHGLYVDHAVAMLKDLHLQCPLGVVQRGQLCITLYGFGVVHAGLYENTV